MPGEAYLNYPKYQIKKLFGRYIHVKALFIPYAAVTFSFNEYERKVNERFMEIGHSVVGIHHFDNALEAVEKAEAIVVGGGNTWQLVRMLHDKDLMQVIQ